MSVRVRPSAPALKPGYPLKSIIAGAGVFLPPARNPSAPPGFAVHGTPPGTPSESEGLTSQENGSPLREDQGGRAKDVQFFHGKSVVFSKPGQHLTVFQVFLKPSHIQMHTLANLTKSVNIIDFASLLVPGPQQGNVKGSKESLSLISCRFRRPERAQPTGGIALRLLPELPIRPLLTVDLFQAEIPPVNDQTSPRLLFHLLQPNCCIVDIRSKKVEIDINR